VLGLALSAPAAPAALPYLLPYTAGVYPYAGVPLVYAAPLGNSKLYGKFRQNIGTNLIFVVLESILVTFYKLYLSNFICVPSNLSKIFAEFSKNFFSKPPLNIRHLCVPDYQIYTKLGRKYQRSCLLKL